MLIRTKILEDIKLCEEKLSKHFTETYDYLESDFQEDNIYLLTNEDRTYFSIIRIEDDFIHYDFSYLDKDLRGKGIGTQYIKEIIDFFKDKNQNIRATVRLSNFASYKSLAKCAFVERETSVIGTDLGIEMIYYYPIKIDINKYISTKPSSCGLTVLSAISELKYKKYIKPDDLKIPCIPNKGIPKETMVQGIQCLFNEYNFKVLSNFSLSTELCFHQLENWFTSPNRFAIIDVMDEIGYEHWMLLYAYDGQNFRILDNLNGSTFVTKQKIFSKMVQANMFTILL